MRSKWTAVLLVVALVAAFVTVAPGAGASAVQEYEVTIENLTTGQPMSPPVLATFNGSSSRAFKVGREATPEVEAVAEDGNQIPQFEKWSDDSRVTDVVDVGMPLVPSGSTAGGFTSAVTVDISGHPGDRLGLVTMLICTNDGFTGLDKARLPNDGSKVYLTDGYDAGTEDNTELSEDIVDPCSGIGPVGLPGDADGNRNDEVDTPDGEITHHPNIAGGGELTADTHGWEDPVLKVTITHVDADGDEFEAELSGAAEIPPVTTDAEGEIDLELLDNDVLEYDLELEDITEVTQAHIHLGSPAENGPVVAFLFGMTAPTGPIDGELIEGALVPGHLVGPLEGDWSGFVSALRGGDLYVNVHTVTNPAGEVRGQIGAED